MTTHVHRGWRAWLLAGLSCFVSSAVSSAQTNMVPSTMSQIATGVQPVSGLAVDAKGNLFVLDSWGIHEWMAVNGVVTASSKVLTLSYTTRQSQYIMQDGYLQGVKPGGGQTWTSITIDGAGNIYCAAYTPASFYGYTGWVDELQNVGIASSDANGNALFGYVETSDLLAGGLNESISLSSDGQLAFLINDADPSNRSVDSVGINPSSANYGHLSGISYSSRLTNPQAAVYAPQYPGPVVADPAYASLLVPSIGSSSSNFIIGGGLNNPLGLAADAHGNIFVADTGNNAVKEVPYACVSESCTITLAGEYVPGFSSTSPFTYVNAVTVNQTGDVYVSDYGKGIISRIATQTFDLGSENLCTSSKVSACTKTMVINYYYPSSTGDTLSTITVVNGGSLTGDFSLRNPTCETGASASELAERLCSVEVAFTPQAPGLRTGAVVITDGNYRNLATTYLQGYGVGAAATFDYGTRVKLGSGYNQPASLAVDGSGNVWVADTGGGAIWMTAAGTTSAVQQAIRVTQPVGIAVDGAGSILITDWSTGTLFRYNRVRAQLFTVATGFQKPSGIAVDGAGNAYVADAAQNAVFRVTPSGAISQAVTGLNYPYGVALDAANNLYVSDTGNRRVLKITPAGVQSTVGKNWLWPGDMAADPSGALYVADIGAAQVVRVAADGEQTKVGSGFKAPLGLSLNAAGDIFIGDIAAQTVTKLPRAVAGGLSFPNTAVRRTSAPYSVQIGNIGNAPLGPIHFGDANFIPVSASGINPNCVNGSSLEPGAVCNLSLAFRPTTSGLLSGWVQTASPATPATPSMLLSGTGTP